MRLSTKNILALSDINTSENPLFLASTYRRQRLTQAQSYIPSIFLSYLLQNQRSILPVITIQLPLSLSNSMYIVCSCICRPTDTKMINETERVQRSEVLLLRKRWDDRFFMVRSRSVACTQKKQMYATILQNMYCMPNESRIKPRSRLSMIMKKMASRLPICQLIKARGSRQQIIRPKPDAISPNISLVVGNYLPYMYVYTLVASVLFLIGFRFQAKSFFITLQIGAIAETIGTRTPINNPPIIESPVGVIQYLYPKNSQKTEVTTLRAPQAKGYAAILANKTYFIEPARILAMIKARLAPITFNKAKSKFFFSTPILNMLFIISTLSRNKEQMMSWNITPINMPIKPKFFRLPAIGIEVQTDINPIFYISFQAKLLKVRKVYSQLGLEQILILFSKLIVASVEKSPKLNCSELINLTKGEVDRSYPFCKQVQLSICCNPYLISRQTQLLTCPIPNLPDAVSNTSFTINSPIRKFSPAIRVFNQLISSVLWFDQFNSFYSQFFIALKIFLLYRTNLVF